MQVKVFTIDITFDIDCFNQRNYLAARQGCRFKWDSDLNLNFVEVHLCVTWSNNEWQDLISEFFGFELSSNFLVVEDNGIIYLINSEADVFCALNDVERISSHVILIISKVRQRNIVDSIKNCGKVDVLALFKQLDINRSFETWIKSVSKTEQAD